MISMIIEYIEYRTRYKFLLEVMKKLVITNIHVNKKIGIKK